MNKKSYPRSPGFTLPAVLVVVSALLLLAIGLLLVVNTERKTARSYVDRQRAELATLAGLENVKKVLEAQTKNDDFLVISGNVPKLASQVKDQTPYLYIARGSGGGASVSYNYFPLFSNNGNVIPSQSSLVAPNTSLLTNSGTQEISALPWYESAKVSWINVTDNNNKIISRYAYWVEDLQSKINPKNAGNILNTITTPASHTRSKFPDSPAKPLVTGKPVANAIALHALDPSSGDIQVGKTAEDIINARNFMLSPDSVIGALGTLGKIGTADRNATTGLLTNPLAASLERNLAPTIQAYKEQPLVPFASGISAQVTGQPKLDLNTLLAVGSGDNDIAGFANWVNTALPQFEQTRKGGFPDDYLKTLAANALDYADSDNKPTISGNVRGIDGYPNLSEVALKVEYLGYHSTGGMLYLDWKLKLFAEFWNMTNIDVSGNVKLSYEVALNHSAIGTGIKGIPFDDADMLNTAKIDALPGQSYYTSKDLTFDKDTSKFYGPEVSVTLRPDEYKFYKFAEVECSICVGTDSVSYNTKFLLEESASDQRGVSVIWNNAQTNNVQTERISKIVRDLGAPNSGYMEFTILYQKTIGKAAIPGGSYGPHGEFVNNMGDPRMSNYFRSVALGENSITNLSPNRRNIRRSTIYDGDVPSKRWHYGRVLPSEWPDGGQNSSFGLNVASLSSNGNFAIEPTAATFNTKPTPLAANAPQRISNAGKFYSATELGYTYDPIMWTPKYPDLPNDPGSGERDSTILNASDAKMPEARNAWPEVSNTSSGSDRYGGGNTLRIGRPEHEKFNTNETHAARLLDIFYAGDTNLSPGTINIEGNVNINTAEKDTIRAMVAGALQQDPEIRKVTNWNHDTLTGRYSPTTTKYANTTSSNTLGAPTSQLVGDKIADGIVKSRPFGSMKDLACAKDNNGALIFGNKAMYPDANNIQWSDAACEEIFTRLHEAITLRSRNFRVWVIGQSLAPSNGVPEVLAESRKVFTIFSDPGVRNSSGAIVPDQSKVKVLYEKDF